MPITAFANPLAFITNKKKFKEMAFIAETYGPAAFKCYHRATGGLEFDISTFQRALKSQNMKECLQEKAKEQADYIQHTRKEYAGF